MQTRLLRVAGIILVLVGAVFSSAGIFILLQPDQYRAVARIKVDREPARPDANGNLPYDPYFIQTEYEVLQSEVILGKVVGELNLNSEWGKKYAGGKSLKTSETIALLKRRLNFRPARNAKLIEIRVISDEPAEAAQLANAIAETYRQYRENQRIQLANQGIKAMTEQMEQQEQEIKRAQENVERLKKELNVPEPEPAELGTNPSSAAWN